MKTTTVAIVTGRETQPFPPAPAQGGETSPPSEQQDDIHQEILQALKGLQFGEVTITVREGRIVQIERIARRRHIVSKRPQSGNIE